MKQGVINSPKLFEIIENQKNNFMKKQHEELRTKNVHLSIFPKYYKEIIETIKHPLNTEQLKGIYFPGSFESKITTTTYPLPFSCTIFLVVEILDLSGGVVSRMENEKMLFYLNEIIFD